MEHDVTFITLGSTVREIADRAYESHAWGRIHDDGDGVIAPDAIPALTEAEAREHTSGDCLRDFIALEMSEVDRETDHTMEERLLEAIRLMDTAIGDLEAVREALIAHWRHTS